MYSLQPVTDREFDTYARSQPTGNFLQTKEMAELRRALGWDVHPLLFTVEHQPVGALLLAGKQGRYEITMGPVMDLSDAALTAELLTHITRYVRKLGGHSVELYPYVLSHRRSSNGAIEDTADDITGQSITKSIIDNGWKHKGLTVDYDIVANRWVFVKDLSDLTTEAELLASYRQTTRQTIKKLVAADYRVKKLGLDELHITKDLIDSSNDRNGVPGRDLAYYNHLYRSFGDAIEFLVVYHGDTPISTGIFISHPNELVYFMSGANSAYRHLYGGHFLQHYVMSRAIKHGVKRYNFYGISGHFKDNPLLTYKAGFRGHVEEYIGGFVYVVNPRKKLQQKLLYAPKAIARKMIR